MELPALLWVDLSVATREAELPRLFSRFFKVTYLDDPRRQLERKSLDAFACVCFDFDYPDRQALHLMQHTNERNPSVPMLMMTTQHSEALAIWAFRTRLWDYFVKPVPEADLERSLRSLLEISLNRRKQRDRLVYLPKPTLPQEVRLAARSPDELLLLPAVYYVEKNFRKKILINELAELCEISSFRFSRAFHSVYGITFQDYLLRYRVKEACRLLDNPNASVADVSYIVGFNDPSYFARMFRRYVGLKPSEYATSNKRPKILEPLPMAGAMDDKNAAPERGIGGVAVDVHNSEVTAKRSMRI